MLASVRFSNRAVQAAPAGPVASPIDGVWRARWTHAELVNSPLTVLPDEDNDGNWGTYTITFKRGRVTEAQSNRLGKWAGCRVVPVDAATSWTGPETTGSTS